MQGNAQRRPGARRAACLRAGRRTLAWVGWALAAHHGLLLARRLIDASIFEPTVLLRWAGAAAIAVLAADLRRRGVSLSRGRAPVALSLLVLLLHVGVPAPAPEGADFLLVLPVGVAAGLGAAALAGLVRRRRPRITRPVLRALTPAEPASFREPLGAFPARFSPRPPPVR
ncbi:MAG: hypothetical protein KDB94_10640 [Acidobacteria bacterium]|nr:hypothetical protein [Acidobacteriota bacterium]